MKFHTVQNPRLRVLFPRPPTSSLLPFSSGPASDLELYLAISLRPKKQKRIKVRIHIPASTLPHIPKYNAYNYVYTKQPFERTYNQSPGIGRDRSWKGSRVTEIFLQVRHFTLLSKIPSNTSLTMLLTRDLAIVDKE